MKKLLPWHHTRIGAIVLWLGSIELAVPVLGLTAVALAAGTYLDSTQGAKVAKEAVYGAGWFIAVMALVCVSLVFAVITRFPWKLRHVGFITVHAGLLGLIVGGFISLFGRVEGHLPLEEGKSASTMETQDEQVELVEHKAGQFSVLGAAPGPSGPATMTLGGTRIQVVERWDNSRDEQVVNDDAPEPFRGVQVVAQHGVEPTWVGEEGKAGPAPVIAGLLIRVLPDGASWEPAPKPAAAAGTETAGFKFIVDGHEYPLGDAEQEAFPGWTLKSIKRYTRAFVGADGLIEAQGGPENPAVDVTITDGKGNTERHTSFLNFTDMVMSRAVEGEARSGARLLPAKANSTFETLIVYGPVAETRVGYISPTGEARVIEPFGAFPRTIELGTRHVTIARQFARARGGWQTLRAEPGKDNRPALLLRVGNATELMVVPFKGTAPLPSTQNLMVRYGPRMVTVPFSVRLVDFRKTDYPGTEMAMAYESDVEITLPGMDAAPFRIFMNHPFTQGPWKVYQSGFVGDSVSVFSIMRDPGLSLTYAASTVLCIGILITFFSRSLSWGHPGISVAGFGKEPLHASPLPLASTPDPVAVLDRPVSTCGV